MKIYVDFDHRISLMLSFSFMAEGYLSKWRLPRKSGLTPDSTEAKIGRFGII